MSAVVEFVSDVVEDVVDAVGDVVEAVGDFVEEAVETVGNVVEAVIEDPLPVLLSVAGSFVGIPPMITNAAITAARGGDLEDIVLSAGTAYFAPAATNAISSTLSASIGDAIINEAISDVVVDGISKGLVNGVVSEVRGGDFEDGFAGGFTGTVVGAGVGEVSDFVSEEVLTDFPDLGQVGTIAEKALTAGVTAELTGRGDFDTAFTNSMINGTANLGANYAVSSISDQFKATTTTEFEIVGSEEGNEETRELLTSELDTSWAETSGVMGTGAGIPDEIVDEVEVSDLGYETPNVDEDPMMAESMGASALDTELSGYDSPTDYLEAEAEFNAPVEDVSDIAMEYGEELPTDSYDETIYAEQQPVGIEEQPAYEQTQAMLEELGIADKVTPEEQPVNEYDQALYAEEMPLAQKAVQEEPKGGLSAVAQPDALDQFSDSMLKPQTEESVVDVAGEKPGIGMKATGLGALAAGLMPTTSGDKMITGALNQILKPAIRQGITKTLRGTPSRPAMKRPAQPQRVKAPAPRMTPQQLAQMRQAQPVTPKPATTQARVAPPKKKDVSTLTPVSNIAGLTSLLKNKG